MDRSLFVSAKDVQNIENCHETTAYRRLKTIKDCLSKEPHQKITIDEFCNFEGITIEQFLSKTTIIGKS